MNAREGMTVYFAMDEIGSDNVSRLRLLGDPDLIWSEIGQIAAGFGFQGIQFTSSLYEQKLGLSLKRIPDLFGDFRLTYHISGVRPLASSADVLELEALLGDSLEIASRNRMEDVSFHPPRLAYPGDEAPAVRSLLKQILKRWLPRYADNGITLSLESHSCGQFFVFDGLSEFSRFVSEMPELGVLVDISHLWNDGNDAVHIALAFSNCRVTGLHVSDALSGVEVTKGTHLPIGEGEVDFAKILAPYAADDSVYAVFEVKAESCRIKHGVEMLRRVVDCGALDISAVVRRQPSLAKDR